MSTDIELGSEIQAALSAMEAMILANAALSIQVTTPHDIQSATQAMANPFPSALISRDIRKLVHVSIDHIGEEERLLLHRCCEQDIDPLAVRYTETGAQRSTGITVTRER